MRLARWGTREILAAAALAAVAVALVGAAAIGTGAVWIGAFALVPLVLFGWVLWFFRDPPRTIPAGDGLVLAPADGTVTHIDVVDDPDAPGAKLVRYSMFLSVFNVHLNRAPLAGRVARVEHRPGKFLDAREEDSSEANERNDLVLETDDPRCPRVTVRQIAGKIARRIVCDARPGDRLAAGDCYGMIKFGSRTTLLFPAGTRLAWRVKVGDKITAGETILATLEGPA